MKQMAPRWLLIGTGCAAMALSALPLSSAFAQDSAAAPDAPPAPPAKWVDTLKLYGQIDAGATYNSVNPQSGKNFGRLLDDRTGALLNQVLLTATRPIDPTVEGYDFGFKLQGMYGSDARYARPPHELSGILKKDQNQIDLVEANVQVHAPWLVEGGVDWKVGRFAALEGAETLDPSNNSFYSHSYIFNFGIPMQSTGVNSTWHVNSVVDLWLGFDSGVNASLDHGLRHAYNGDYPAFSGGFGLNNPFGTPITFLALTHIGNENPTKAVANGLLPIDANKKTRMLNDVVTIWKVNDAFTLTNEMNWIHDDGINAGHAANAYGMTQYATYALSDQITLAGRAEFYRDDKGVFVAQSGNNYDFLAGETGIAAVNPLSVNGSLGAGTAVTYSEFTLGVNYKPTLSIPYLQGLVLRPEVRYDAAIDGHPPFAGTAPGKGANNTWTGALDAILTF